jgi:PIN domain nuclease of toxin-antitoxin system
VVATDDRRRGRRFSERPLLDVSARYTCIVWAIAAPQQLPAKVRNILASREVTASVVSYWELVLKKGRQTAPVLDPKTWWHRYVMRPAVEVLPERTSHIDQLDVLPVWHRNPFDRMLIAQALAENCTLVSRDDLLDRYGVLDQYGVPLVWK